MRKRIPLAMLALISLLSGCASTLDELTPPDAADMTHLYQGEGTPTDPAKAPIHDGAADLGVSYMRTAYNEIAQRFPYLPNPTLCGYVYPHITRAGAPVPGYTTCFPLYESNPFALPGEIQ